MSWKRGLAGECLGRKRDQKYFHFIYNFIHITNLFCRYIIDMLHFSRMFLFISNSHFSFNSTSNAQLWSDYGEEKDETWIKKVGFMYPTYRRKTRFKHSISLRKNPKIFFFLHMFPLSCFMFCVHWIDDCWLTFDVNGNNRESFLPSFFAFFQLYFFFFLRSESQKKSCNLLFNCSKFIWNAHPASGFLSSSCFFDIH